MLRNALRLVTPPPLYDALQRLRRWARPTVNEAVADKARGIIHVGAHLGEEATLYATRRLPVIWVEPIPAVYERLCRAILSFPAQQALNALIGDRDGLKRTLHIADNDGLSSSVFDLDLHRDIWPEVHYCGQIEMISKTLPTALAGIDTSGHDALVLDVQGAELEVLRGATSMLQQFRFIQAEAADFSSYKNAATVAQIEQFLAGQGFKLSRREQFAAHPSGGRYFDLLFRRHSTAA
jgi:FkbM family methyltransferase